MSRLAEILEPLVQLTLVRFREFYREPESIFWVLIFPPLLAAGLALAFRDAPPAQIKVAAATPALADALRGEKLLEVQMLPVADAETALRNGKVVLVAEPRSGGGVFYRYDATNPGAREARMIADRAIQRAGGQVDPVATSDQLVVEPGSRYIDFLLPGLVAMTLMTSAVWGVGYTIVDARRRHLLKRLVAAPMPRSTFLLSFLIFRLAMMVVEAGAVLVFGVIALGVPLRGSFPALCLSCIMTTLACTALGLLIAARARTTEAVAGLTNFIVMPMWIISGVFFSAQRFPDWLQPAIRLLPLTASIDALRANMLEGAGAAQILPELAILAAWTLTCFAVALRIFRWR